MSGIIGEVVVSPDDWHLRFLRLAQECATWSKDPKHKVGAVIVDGRRREVSKGYNGFPVGVADTRARLTDVGVKRVMTVHAELNAILNSPVSVRGCAMYSTRFPCHECAKAIIQSGIILVAAPPPDTKHPVWGASWQASFEMLSEAGVSVLRLPVPTPTEGEG